MAADRSIDTEERADVADNLNPNGLRFDLTVNTCSSANAGSIPE